MTKRVLVPIAEGFEEIEAITVIDILRRAGAEVVVAGLKTGPVVGRSQIAVEPDCTLDDALATGAFQVIALPGGRGGTFALRDDPRIIDALRQNHAAGQLNAAICAAPLVLKKAGLLEQKAFTSHPSMKDELNGPNYDDHSRVVCSENLVTSRGPGTAMEFAFELVRQLFGPAKAEEVNAGVLAQI